MRMTISPRSWLALALVASAAALIAIVLAWRADLATQAETAADASVARAAQAAEIGIRALANPTFAAPAEAGRLRLLRTGDPALSDPSEAMEAALDTQDRTAIAAAALDLTRAAYARAAFSEAEGDRIDDEGDGLMWVIFPLAALAVLGAIGSLIADWRKARAGAAAMSAARERAEEAAAAKSLMLAAASHDVRQPLQAMSLLLSALKRRVDPGEAAEIVEKIERAAGSLRRLFGSLLDVARLEAHVVRAEPLAFPLEPVLEHLITEADEIATHAGGRVHMESSALWLNTDPQLLEVIVRNLLSNAVKVSRGGEVRLRCVEMGGDAARIEVCDSGPPLPQDALDRVFSGRPLPGERVGLGLFIVREMAAILDVAISARPGANGGAIVSIIVKRAPARATEPVGAG